jgi:hypothetical protein
MGRQQRGIVGKNQHSQQGIEHEKFKKKSQNYCSTGDSRTEYS